MLLPQRHFGYQLNEKVLRVKTHPTPRRGKGRKMGEEREGRARGYGPISYEKCAKSHVRQCGGQKLFPPAVGFHPYRNNYAPCHFFLYYYTTANRTYSVTKKDSKIGPCKSHLCADFICCCLRQFYPPLNDCWL